MGTTNLEDSGVESHWHSCRLCRVASSLPTMQEVEAESVMGDNQGYPLSPLPSDSHHCGLSRPLRQLCACVCAFRPGTLA